MKLHLFFDLTDIDKNRIINEEILYKVFNDSGVLDKIMFSTYNETTSLKINSILNSYAENKNLSGLIDFLKYYKFYIEYCNANLNILVIGIW